MTKDEWLQLSGAAFPHLLPLWSPGPKSKANDKLSAVQLKQSEPKKAATNPATDCLLEMYLYLHLYREENVLQALLVAKDEVSAAK